MSTKPRLAARSACVSRETKETQIQATLCLDGKGEGKISTGVGFFDHMLEQTCRHGLLDCALSAKGDLHIDAHHVIEDCGYVFGAALAKALGDRAGIARYGWALLPMDESLARVAVDMSGRAALVFQMPFTCERIGECDTSLFAEFFSAFTLAGGLALHASSLYGRNDHHRIEGIFKGLGHALRQAVARDSRSSGVLSTKGSLSESQSLHSQSE